MSPRASRIGALICAVAFVVISLLVSEGVTNDWDIAAVRSVAELRSPGTIRVMQAMSLVGNWQGTVPFLVIVAALLWLKRRRSSAGRYLLVALSGEVSWVALKALFHRPRPVVATHLSDAGWYSYPSGHSTLAPIIWGLGFILLGELTRSTTLRATCWLLAVLVPLIIGFSRVYLGVHYPTDVLGGLVIGCAWVLLWHVQVRNPVAGAPAS